MKPLFHLSLGLFVLILGCKTQTEKTPSQLIYPESPKIDHVDVYHETKVEDPYQWLEDDRSEETATWVKAQNEVTFGFLDDIDFRDDLKARLENLMDYEKYTPPSKEGEYEYFSKNDGLQNHSVQYRKKIGTDNSQAEVFLDPNTFSEDGTVALVGLSFNKKGNLATYMISEGGADWRKIITIDADTRKEIEDTLINVKFSAPPTWIGSEGYYYSSYDKPKEGSQLSGKTQYHKLLFHKLGTPQSEDQLIFGGEAQPNRYIGVEKSEDERYLIIYAAQNTSGGKVYVQDLQRADKAPILIQDDYFSRCTFIDNEGSDLLFLTNIDAPKYRLVKIDLNKPEKKYWKEIIPESENVLRVTSGGGKLFANYMIDAKTSIQQFDMEGNFERELELPGIGTANVIPAKKDEKEIYYVFSSFTYPSTFFKYNIASRESTEYIRPEVNFSPFDYETKQVFYTSKDGTKVPMFVVHKKGIELNGKNPTYLYAYGGFNISLTPGFNPMMIAWLENGGIYAQPNLRGGGEYGEEWHLAGTKMNKQNVFDDFIAAGEFLIEEKLTSSDYLAIVGGSNGGLLVGAVMTQRPDLAKVALPAVGVMDMLKYHTFTSGAGWAADYGTAEESKEMFEYLRGYSPYHNMVEGTDYPATLVTTSDHDDRVVPAHSFKFLARLQETHAGQDPVLIRIQTNAGHGSVSMSQRIDRFTDLLAFSWHNMGYTPLFDDEVIKVPYK
ncbi:MAG: prolyl oligopeptidase family serine peptidase [Bacteroidota bacterium]